MKHTSSIIVIAVVFVMIAVFGSVLSFKLGRNYGYEMAVEESKAHDARIAQGMRDIGICRYVEMTWERNRCDLEDQDSGTIDLLHKAE